ncbi:hypothetical protein GT037_000199 [Alternaria burnsii]|uniref:Uncharacterized protein n=1 Tax=Alternaria burnsii TaxID=1187904 RepID=A0A8H7BG07_9PLEO|nr:uncharacterized protein GT037_000199 [Alternaria burnsii]KAF7681223.1 hypothetical protein GT037_000199 [Alternaria burnsii]
MKLALPILAAIATSSEAAFCNGGWGLPSGSSCPSPYVSTARITRKPAPTAGPSAVKNQEVQIRLSLHLGLAYTLVGVDSPPSTLATVADLSNAAPFEHLRTIP